MAEDLLPLSDSSPAPLIPFLPDDVSMLCIARVPAASHTTLSHVSRSWRSFVRSPSFFSVRSELAVTEPVLTVSIHTRNNNRSRWYHLRPHQPPSPLPPTLEQQQGHVSPLPPTLGQQKGHVDDDDDDDTGNNSAAASLGPRIFLVNENSSFQIYDAGLGRWSHGPPIPRPITYVVATVAGGRLHVISCGDNLLDHPPSIESLDITETRWDPLPPIPIPAAHMFRKRTWSSAVIDGKLILCSGGGYAAVFDPDTGEWGPTSSFCHDSPVAVVGGVPYVFVLEMERVVGLGDDGRWRMVEGEFFAELVRFILCVRLLNFGGLLCLVGTDMGSRSKDCCTISCTAIAISRTDNGGFRGSVVWSDHSLLALSRKEYLYHPIVMEL